MTQKTCTLCKETKDEMEFRWRNKAKGVRQHQCAECAKANCKRWYKKNSKDHISKVRFRKEKNAVFVKEQIAAMKLSCIKCGNNHPAVLDFHHRDPSEKEGGVSQMIWWYTPEKVLKEIEKCDVLCSNCHRVHHYEERMLSSLEE